MYPRLGSAVKRQIVARGIGLAEPGGGASETCWAVNTIGRPHIDMHGESYPVSASGATYLLPGKRDRHPAVPKLLKYWGE